MYLPIYWVRTWITEKFGQKIGCSNCLLIILLNMACFIPAKCPKTPAWYVAFKPLGYNVYAYIALSVLTLISERSLFLAFVTLIATCYRYKTVNSSCIVKLKWRLPDDNLSCPVSTQSKIMWSISHVKLD